jgi:hypothetical protein
LRYSDVCFSITYRSHKGNETNSITNGMNVSCRRKIKIYEYFRSPINRFYNIYAYCAVSKKIIKEVKQSYYNLLIEMSNHKVKTLWNIIRNDTGKMKRAEKISEMNLGAGNIENAK